MDKKQIVDYCLNCNGRINPAILNNLLDQLIAENKPAQIVKTPVVEKPVNKIEK